VLIHERVLPAISEAVGEASVAWAAKWRVLTGAGAKGLTGVAVEVLESTAMIREMYRTVFGEGIGELEVASR
jgi:hypothetical protein